VQHMLHVLQHVLHCCSVCCNVCCRVCCSECCSVCWPYSLNICILIQIFSSDALTIPVPPPPPQHTSPRKTTHSRQKEENVFCEQDGTRKCVAVCCRAVCCRAVCCRALRCSVLQRMCSHEQYYLSCPFARFDPLFFHSRRSNVQKAIGPPFFRKKGSSICSNLFLDLRSRCAAVCCSVLQCVAVCSDQLSPVIACICVVLGPNHCTRTWILGAIVSPPPPLNKIVFVKLLHITTHVTAGGLGCCSISSWWVL